MERYSRHLLVEGFTEKHQQKLKSAKVLVVGAGGLGSPVLYYLAGAGVGTLGVVDFDVVSESNLNRQILYSPDLIGEQKVDETYKKIKNFAPNCDVKHFNSRLTHDNAVEIISQFDIVADGTDNFDTRYLIDDACGELGKPYVYATAEQMGGQISVFHFKGAGSYRDLYPEEAQPSENPPGIIGATAGIVGSYEALEVIKVITGLGTNLSGKLMIIDALNHQHQLFPIG